MSMGPVPSLISSSLTWLWLIVYGAVFLSHIRCIAVNAGPYRLWHGIHCLMAIAMADMFAPGGWHWVSAATWQAVFLVVTALIVFRVVHGGMISGPSRFVWTLTGVDMAAMAYMVMPFGDAKHFILYALGGYFVIEAYAWFAGQIALDGKQRPRTVFVLGREQSGVSENAFLNIVCSAEHRIMLGVMSAGMAYMFTIMSIGM